MALNDHPISLLDGFAIGTPENAQFQPVDGRIIRDSLIIMLGTTVACLFVAAPLGSFVAWSWWQKWALGDRWASWYGVLIWAIFAVLGILGGFASLVCMFRRERLVLGEECLQSVIGGKRVAVQIPYSNIAKIELIRNREGWFAEDFIGIVLADIKDTSTLCPAAEANVQSVGWRHKIPKGFRPMPLEQLYELIRKQIPYSW